MNQKIAEVIGKLKGLHVQSYSILALWQDATDPNVKKDLADKYADVCLQLMVFHGASLSEEDLQYFINPTIPMESNVKGVVGDLFVTQQGLVVTGKEVQS